MAAGNFLVAMNLIIAHTGGWDERTQTIHGVGLGHYRQIRPGASLHMLRLIPMTDIREIYHQLTWLPIRGNELPSGIDLAVFDMAAVHGVSTAVCALQAVVGANQSGVMDASTMRRVKGAPIASVLLRLTRERMRYVRERPCWHAHYDRDTRRVVEILTTALAWAGIRPEQVHRCVRSAIADAAMTRAAIEAIGTGVTGVGIGLGVLAIVVGNSPLEGAGDFPTITAVLLAALVCLGVGAFLWLHPDSLRYALMKFRRTPAAIKMCAAVRRPAAEREAA